MRAEVTGVSRVDRPRAGLTHTQTPRPAENERAGPPSQAPLKSRHCACCMDHKARVTELRDLTKARGEEIDRLRTELDHALADAARYQAAFEACMGTRGGA